jgi:hypothetical protein
VAALFGGRTKLSTGQRYHFVAGWLPWLADGANLLLNAAALVWSCAMILWPTQIDPPLIAFSAFPVGLFVFKIAKLVHLYGTRVGAGLRQTIGAGLAGLALTHTVGRAVVAGMLGGERPFFRTPKLARKSALLGALWAVREEALWWIGLVGAAALVQLRIEVDSPDVSLWVAMLSIQSIPYAATLVCAGISALPAIPARLLGPLERLDRRTDPDELPVLDWDRAA